MCIKIYIPAMKALYFACNIKPRYIDSFWSQIKGKNVFIIQICFNLKGFTTDFPSSLVTQQLLLHCSSLD